MIQKYIFPAYYFFLGLIGKGHERSVKAKKNIVSSIVIKGLSISISFLLVPLTINYVNPSNYGIWLTLSSIVGWFSFFDIGLTHGLRNKYAEAKARGDIELAQIYVSTAYGVLLLIFMLVWLVFLVVNPFLNWASILNLSPDMAGEVSMLALVVFTYFCFQFVFRIITTIITADQSPAKASLIDLIGQFSSLCIVAIMVVTTQGSLLYLGIALCAGPLLVLVFANAFFFSREYKEYRPVISKIKFPYAKKLFGLGLVFFVIEIAAIIQYQSSNIIIARSFGVADVTSYNIAYKYFNVLYMVFVIFISPFWSASTEAYEKNDMDWIRNSIKKYQILGFVLMIIGVVMFILSDVVYDLWLGEGVVEINWKLSLWAFIYFTVINFGLKYTVFLNSISALRLQFWSSIITPFLYIGIVYLFISYFNMGVYSLFIAAIIANLYGFAIAPLQYYMIVEKKKGGIWIK